ncbi:MAG: hypothetical protein KDA84_29040, partial [Planctomycetaceae bacterium]|nr:hypothetical protein [Planctomycetaceae bacterium]
AESGHVKPIEELAITPDQTLLATLSYDGVVMAWDLKAAQTRNGIALPNKDLSGFAISPDGSVLASGTKTGKVTLWKAAAGDSKAEVIVEFQGKPNIVGIAFSPDGKHVAVSNASELQVWDRESGKSVATFPDGKIQKYLQYDSQGKSLVGVQGTNLLVWDASTLTSSAAKPKTISVEKAEEINAVAFTPDGGQIAVGGKEDSSVWVFDATNGQLLHDLNVR